MRVDWCVSSWFRIKNTHSLTLPVPCECRHTASNRSQRAKWGLPQVQCCCRVPCLVGIAKLFFVVYCVSARVASESNGEFFF